MNNKEELKHDFYDKHCENHEQHNSKHSHSHNHDHDHGHSHSHDLENNKLLPVTILNLSITIVQIIGGVLSNSLSLLSDAFHNLGDSSALFIAFIANRVSNKKADFQHTFGYKRVEILAALFNSVALIAICIFLLYESYKRFMNPEPVHGELMLVIAIFGLLANLISMIILEKGKDKNLNIRAAYLHLLGDTLSSVAVIIGAVVMWFWQIYWIDPLVSVIVSLYIIYHTWRIVKETVDILMQATPEDINLNEIKNSIEKLSGINDIHHIHVWKLDDTHTFLEAHVNVKNNINMDEMMNLKANAENVLRNNFGISHITLQMGYQCCDGNHEMVRNLG